MLDAVVGGSGGAIILATALDIFRSLLVPRASTRILRVAPALTALLFSGWQSATDRISSGRLRQALRASFAPSVLVLTMTAWASLLISGFGLLFWADRTDFSPGFGTIGDALFAAGSAFSTLGVEGKVDGCAGRLAVLTCSIAGLAIVTVVATFLISIQAGYGRRETLVLQLEARFALPPNGVAILETYALEEITERLGSLFETWELWATEVAITHRSIPILLFFRSNDSRCEWLTAFGAVLDAAALLDATIEDVSAEAKAGARFVLRTGARVLEDISAQFGGGRDSARSAHNATRFHQDRRRLAAAGYNVTRDSKSALERYDERREPYAATLVELAKRLRIDIG